MSWAFMRAIIDSRATALSWSDLNPIINKFKCSLLLLCGIFLCLTFQIYVSYVSSLWQCATISCGKPYQLVPSYFSYCWECERLGVWEAGSVRGWECERLGVWEAGNEATCFSWPFHETTCGQTTPSAAATQSHQSGLSTLPYRS